MNVTTKFNSTYSALIIILSMVLMTGCSNTTVLDRAQLQANKVSVINLDTAEELTFEASNATASVGASYGLIGVLTTAIIDTAVNSNRQKVLNGVVKGLNYNIQDNLNKKLRGMTGVAFKPNIRVVNKKRSTKDKLYSLAVDSRTALTVNHQNIRTQASMYLKTEEGKTPYSKTYDFLTKIPLNLKGDEKINVTAYLTKNPQVLKTTIDTSLNELVKKIANELNLGK